MTISESGESLARSSEPKKFESKVVGMPEYLRKETIEGLLPDVIAYVRPAALTYDEYTKTVWLTTDIAIKSDNLTLDPYTGTKQQYIAVMPLLDEKGVRTYVVDATGLSYGELDTEEDWLNFKQEAEEGAEPSEHTQKRRKKNVAVAAAAFTNLDDEIEFHGLATHFAALDHVVTTYTNALYGHSVADEAEAVLSNSDVPTTDPSQTEQTPNDSTETSAVSVPGRIKIGSTTIEIVYRLPDDPLFWS